MSVADRSTYLLDLANQMKIHWPENKTINIVCHGHSVPSGYFATPMVDTFNAYPHLVHRGLKERYPFAVINVIVTAIGGENSESGSKRFSEDVLCHKPDLVTIDYGLNDRGLSLEAAKGYWSEMIEQAMEKKIKLLLLTPTMDVNELKEGAGSDLRKHADQIRSLAEEYEVGLADSFSVFEKYIKSGGNLFDLLSWANHPSRKGHELVKGEILSWFPIEY